MKYLRGQTILEYIILIGVITVTMFFMAPAFKRGVHSMVKVTADQIGNQQDSDQTVEHTGPAQNPLDWDRGPGGDNGGYMAASNSQINMMIDNARTDRLYVTNKIMVERTDMYSSSITNMGYTHE